MNDKTTFFN